MIRCSRELGLALVGAMALAETVKTVSPPDNTLSTLAVGPDVSLHGICGIASGIPTRYFPMSDGMNTYAIDTQFLDPTIKNRLAATDASIQYRRTPSTIPGLTHIEAKIYIDNGTSFDTVRSMRGRLFCTDQFFLGAQNILHRIRTALSTSTNASHRWQFR